MPLSILVRLRGGRYGASGERPSESEWPPHPARVFCALVASAECDADWDALRWLERQGAPQVWADHESRVGTSQTRGYVVQNAVKRGGGNLSWPGRTNGLRTRTFANPSLDEFAIVWPEAEASAETLSRLEFLAWRVPYVGRSTSRAYVTAIGAMPARIPGMAVYMPVELGQSGQFRNLRIPYPGYTDALRDAYAEGRRSWEVARARPYVAVPSEQQTGGAQPAESVPGPFADLLVWSIERPVARVGGDLVISLASGFRRAVLSKVADPLPGQISGHTSPGRPHVAFLVLPDVAHEHADGHALGLALAVPRDMPDQDLTALLLAVLQGDGLRRIQFGAGRPLAIGYGWDRSGIRPSRWTGGRGEQDWVTVTPVMLDGHTRRGRDEASELARSLVNAGYPEPVEVQVSAMPLVTGGIWRPRPGTLPAGRPRRKMVHARVRFAQPVIGPVLAGSLRYLGLGMFLPRSQATARRGDSLPAAQEVAPVVPARARERESAEVLS